VTVSQNSVYKRIGAIQLPLDGASVTPTGVIPDPALDALLALFKAAINDELAQAWGQAADGTPMAGKSPVQDTLPLEPSSKVFSERKPAFPLLSLHRSGPAEYAEHTLWIEKRTQQWELNYFLDALRVDHLHRVWAALTFVPTIVSSVIRHRGHKAYLAGASQFGPTTGVGALSSIRLMRHESGTAKFASDEASPAYAACTMTIETVELEHHIDGSFPDLAGARFDFGVGGTDGVIPSLIYADTDAPIQ